MDKPKATPKDFFLWAGAMISLYASVFAFISLFFNYIDYAFPDPLQYFSVDPYQGGVSYAMASLIVLFPLYLLLMWTVRRDIAKDSSRMDIWVRKWALVLTLFVAGATIAVDLITLIMYFFNGDLTARFLLKVLAVLLVAAAGVMHFLADMWGYWNQYPERQRSIAYASVVLVIVSIAAGFFIIGTPWQARLYRFDEEKVSDLQQIQSQIVQYWQVKQQLPASLSDLTDSISGFSAPVDPQTGKSFGYHILKPVVGAGVAGNGPTPSFRPIVNMPSFELCATFNAQSRANGTDRNYSVAPAVYGPTGPVKQDSWYHAAGEQCFTRSIDSTLYPPLKAPTKP